MSAALDAHLAADCAGPGLGGCWFCDAEDRDTDWAEDPEPISERVAGLVAQILATSRVAS